MNSTTKGIVAVAVVGGLGFLAYKLFLQDTPQFYAKKIAEAGKHSNETFLKTLDKPFLKEWYKAIKDGKDTFVYNGANYNTQGGKIVK